MIKKRELLDLDTNSAELKLAEHYEKLRILRFQKSMQQIENPLEIKFLKKEIAQLKTLLNEFKLEALYSPPLFHMEHGAYYTKEDGTRVSDKENKVQQKIINYSQNFQKSIFSWWPEIWNRISRPMSC